MPEISIIMPVYNAQDSIVKAIESIQRQTFQDWELIIVDDGSTDNTRSLIKEKVVKEKGRIISINRIKNSGSPVIPRNQGVKWTLGKYLCFLDGDDYWFEDKLEAQLGYMKTVGAVFCYHDLKVYFIDENQNPVREELWSQTAAPHDGHVFDFLLRKNFTPTSSIMMRKSLWEGYGPMDISLDVSHDWDLWLKIAFANQITCLNEVLGVLIRKEGTVIGDSHKRRKESRKVINRWVSYMDGMWYRKIMLYYFVMEIFDILPGSWQRWIRKIWYGQKRYK